MTIEVETPGGTKSASSIIGVDVQVGSGALAKQTSGSPVNWKIRGDAPALQVSDATYLFALLSGPSPDGQAGRNALTVFADMASYDPGRQPLPVDQVANAKRGENKPLAVDAYPMFVTFTDINDPTSMRRVDPANFSSSLGVSLKSVSLSITDEPVTEGKLTSILKWLTWPKIDQNINGGRSETLRYPNDSARGYGTVGIGDFIRR